MIDIRWVRALLRAAPAGADRSDAFWTSVTRSRLSPPCGPQGRFPTLLPERGDAWLALEHVGVGVGDDGGHGGDGGDGGGGGGVRVDLDVDVPLPEAAAEATRLGALEVGRREHAVVLQSPAGMVFGLTSWTEAGSAAHQDRADQPDLLDQVCLDIPSDHYAREVDFWETLTGWPKRPGSLPEFVSLTRPDGIPLRFLLQRLGEPSSTARAHLDFSTLDRSASRAAHVAVGAQVVSDHEFWTVMRDPAGRTYCLTDRSP